MADVGKRKKRASKRSACVERASKRASMCATDPQTAFGVLGTHDPDALSDEFFCARKTELSGRVGKKRFAHVMGVVETAECLAREYGADIAMARLAALLHDWDKAYDDDGIRARAREFGVDAEVHADMMESMPQLLHGPTAAAALAAEYPSIPNEVLQAVRLHTTGSVCMTDLDMIVYVADMIEPGRCYDGLDELRALVGRTSLEELFVASFAHVMRMLVRRRKLLYTPTVGVWNHYMMRARKRASAEQSAIAYASQGKDNR
ncbi:bis(5'-nucleosyl)-tetraphosphatase (symmetrical) YqeK [Adlercreutzia sp. ZJ141]|uniref:bis(5'-nucleosyl)-tetraphosphatase (symmetrical) YqeK n=1 Tax=Adlercreutzia sp. ZJ141 TaxID=2709406 RepID=UPI001F152DA3|nr:bis(5'-nucleosyl)-tetraphosphatase (symmetrical) YqeK [Adlercreutzia sp. ZJ141]